MFMPYFIHFARQMPSVPSPTPTRALPGQTPSYLADNSTDLVPDAYSIKCTYITTKCLCY